MNHRKDSECPLSSDAPTSSDARTSYSDVTLYPYAAVLRLRVSQIVCGIAALVMGTVAFIEERELNLALAVPTGLATILAAAFSIHSSRGFGGYHPSTPSSAMPYPWLRITLPLLALWTVACSLHLALVVMASRAILFRPPGSSTVTILAGIELLLTIIILSGVVVILYIDYRNDPD